MTTEAVSIAALCAMGLGALLCDPPTIPGPRVPRIVRAYLGLGLALVGFALSGILLRLASRGRQLRAAAGRRYSRDRRTP